MVDLSRDADGCMRARLLDAVPGRSGRVFADWLTQQGVEVTVSVEHAALDPPPQAGVPPQGLRQRHPGRTARVDRGPGRVPCREARRARPRLGVPPLAGAVRRRTQQATLGRRGHKDDPLYRIRRTLLTGVDHLTPRQTVRLNTHLPAGDPDGEVELAWSVYQRVRQIYDHSAPAARGRQRAEKLLAQLHSRPVPELARLGRTLRAWRRFDSSPLPKDA